MGALDVLRGAGDERLAGRRLVGGVVGQGRPIGRRVVAEAGPAGDGPSLGLDRLELVEAGLVDLRRIQVERRPAQDLGPVQLVAVGRRPDPVLLARRGQVLAPERLEERLVGGVDLVPDDGADGLPILVARHGDERRHDGLVDRRRQHPLQLGDRPLGDDPGRGEAAGHRLAQQLAVVGHVLRVGAQAGKEQLEALRRVRGLELAQLRQQGLGPAHLVDDLERVDPLVVLDHEDLADHPQDVARDPVLDAEAIVRDRARLRRACPRRVAGRPRGRPGSGRAAGRRSARRR